VGLVDGLVNRLKNEMNEPCMVIATGGLAKLFAGSSETLEQVEPHLTLQGLRLLYETHRARS
jgi:type III pantothenate kinase